MKEPSIDEVRRALEIVNDLLPLAERHTVEIFNERALPENERSAIKYHIDNIKQRIPKSIQNDYISQDIVEWIRSAQSNSHDLSNIEREWDYAIIWHLVDEALDVLYWAMNEYRNAIEREASTTWYPSPHEGGARL
jgi:hypothetical protein